MKETAKDHFLGRRGRRRLNCAQSVAETFREQFPLDEKKAVSLSACGGGMAPDGFCGAFYAARCIFERHLPHRLTEGMKQLEEAAGSLKCSEVKALRKLPCHECVGKAAEMLESIDKARVDK